MVVDFWFDPICPWAWITSRWLLEVQTVRPIEVHWHLMSLALLNEGKELPEQQRDTLKEIVKPLRVLAAAKTSYGDEVIPPLYAEMGVRFHNEGCATASNVFSRYWRIRSALPGWTWLPPKW